MEADNQDEPRRLLQDHANLEERCGKKVNPAAQTKVFTASGRFDDDCKAHISIIDSVTC